MENFKSYFKPDASIELLRKITKQNWPDFESFNDTSFNTPTRWMMDSLTGSNHNYNIVVLPVKNIKPNQFGEDYINDSSKQTAKNIKKQNTEIRLGDIMPVILGPNNVISDGNHRHAAAIINDQENILALVPVSSGDGQILNLREFYEKL